jgi:Rieske Fe-S protein
MRTKHALLASSLTLLIIACSSGPGYRIPPTAQGTEVVDRSRMWSLRYEGGKVLVHSSELGRPLLLVRDENDSLRAYDSWCTHEGCAITINPAGDLFCSCHSRTFDDDGTPKEKDADLKRALVEYAVSQQGDSILINLGRRTIRDESGTLLPDPASESG